MPSKLTGQLAWMPTEKGRLSRARAALKIALEALMEFLRINQREEADIDHERKRRLEPAHLDVALESDDSEDDVHSDDAKSEGP